MIMRLNFGTTERQKTVGNTSDNYRNRFEGKTNSAEARLYISFASAA